MTPRLLMLVSLKAQIDALIALEQGEMPPVMDPEQCPACGAGAEQQVNTSTLDGVQRRRCANCRRERELVDAA